MEKINICVIGSGNWSTAIAKVIAENAIKLEDVEDKVNMYVYEETFEGKRMSDIINQEHVNSKYLPNVRLPDNLIACRDLVETAKYADIIIFVIPSKFLFSFCKTLFGKIKSQAMALSVMKGFITNDFGGIELASRTITKCLKIPCAVLTGVNLPKEIIANNFCEATIGCKNAKLADLLKRLFQAPFFRIAVVDDCECVELCSILKNITAFGVGLLDGMDCSENIKSTLIRFGLLETIQFADIFYPGCKLATFFESCGISDLITVCLGSCNRRIAETFARNNTPIEQLEALIMNGNKLTGPLAAHAVNCMLQHKGVHHKFPIFSTIHKICSYTAKPSSIIYCILDLHDPVFHPTNTVPM